MPEAPPRSARPGASGSGQPLLAGRDDHRQQPRRRLGRVLLVKREGCLVTVMPVPNQELASASSLISASENSASSRQSCEPTPPSSTVSRVAETVDLDRAVPEEEERLELRARRAEQPQPALLRPRVRAFVGEDDAVLVRLEPERGYEPSRRRSTPSGPTYSCASHQHAGSASRRARPAPATPQGSQPPPPRSRAGSGGRCCTGFVRGALPAAPAR